VLLPKLRSMDWMPLPDRDSQVWLRILSTNQVLVLEPPLVLNYATRQIWLPWPMRLALGGYQRAALDVVSKLSRRLPVSIELQAVK